MEGPLMGAGLFVPELSGLSAHEKAQLGKPGFRPGVMTLSGSKNS